AGNQTLTEQECTDAVQNQWNGFNQDVQRSFADGIHKIVNRLRGADSTVQVIWLGYYDISGTGTSPWHVAPWLPFSCAKIIQEALDVLNGIIQSNVPADAFISTREAMDQNNNREQPLYVVRATRDLLTHGKNPPGWPHPNQLGAEAMAALLPI